MLREELPPGYPPGKLILPPGVAERLVSSSALRRTASSRPRPCGPSNGSALTRHPVAVPIQPLPISRLPPVDGGSPSRAGLGAIAVLGARGYGGGGTRGPRRPGSGRVGRVSLVYGRSPSREGVVPAVRSRFLEEPLPGAPLAGLGLVLAVEVNPAPIQPRGQGGGCHRLLAFALAASRNCGQGRVMAGQPSSWIVLGAAGVKTRHSPPLHTSSVAFTIMPPS